jgi:hypothetical protein
MVKELPEYRKGTHPVNGNFAGWKGFSAADWGIGIWE